MLQVDLENANAFVLQKQHLTPDSKSRDIPMIVKDIGGLHATGSTVPYLSLFARCPDFEKDYLDQELYERKSLAKIRCVRKTIYIHPKELLPILHAATNASVARASRNFMEARGVTLNEYEKISQAIMELLAEKEQTASAIKEALNSPLDISSILYFMCDQGLLVRGKAAKSWRDKSHRYARFHDYFPNLDLKLLDEEEAIPLLLERYIASFGPVTENDILWWTGLGKTQIHQALDKIQGKVLQMSIAGLEGDFLLLRSDLESLSQVQLSCKPTINLLPALDPYLMGYKERERYLHVEHTNSIFDRSGNATSTILVDGKVAGVWDFEEEKEPLIKLFFFSKNPSGIREEVNGEASRLGNFIADKEVKIMECDSMIALPKRPAGGFMSPLRG